MAYLTLNRNNSQFLEINGILNRTEAQEEEVLAADLTLNHHHKYNLFHQGCDKVPLGGTN